MAENTTGARLLEVEGLTFRYRNRKVLDAVSFALGAGERLALMGPSGSGKSTLLHCLSGIAEPEAGAVRVGGQTLALMSERARADLRRRDLALVHQAFHLLPTLSVAENVEMPLQLLGVPPLERHQRVGELLLEMGIAHRADGLPDELSGGEQQRVALARALVIRPKLILADEPTGNLDQRTGAQVLELIERSCQAHGAALLMVTHDASAARICQRVLHLVDGKLEAQAA